MEARLFELSTYRWFAGVGPDSSGQLCDLPLRFLQLPADLFFFAANVVQMALEKR
jgi:hypothetical protein